MAPRFFFSSHLHGRAAALLAPSFFFPCAAARSPCSQPWRPTSLRSGADPKQRPRIPSALRASPDLRSPNIDAVHLGENPVFCVEKASRSTPVDVCSDAQIGISIVLTNIDWVCLW
ncbi:hypothetical protein Zm00014a_027375 [Zea mays]|uniref:Secreted protein n=1 Tax=Zea mays TaxID=4577 RepID=A0A317YBU6_MAIZE|nr:hypothetical protein Zm00014a_027375 [Zea mays]